MDTAPPASELTGPNVLGTNTVVTNTSGSGGNVPPGALTMYCNATPPSGWLICDGTAISRSTYSTLFTIISTTYGVGDGSTTFNLPDLRGRVPVGQGSHADVSSLNANDGQAVANRRPKHRTTNALVGGGATSTESATHTHSGTTGIESATHTHSLPSAYGSGSTQTGPNAANSADFITTTGTQSANHTHAFTSGNASATHTHTDPTPGGSIGSNNANDALDAPSYVVITYIIKT